MSGFSFDVLLAVSKTPFASALEDALGDEELTFLSAPPGPHWARLAGALDAPVLLVDLRESAPLGLAVIESVRQRGFSGAVLALARDEQASQGAIARGAAALREPFATADVVAELLGLVMNQIRMRVTWRAGRRDEEVAVPIWRRVLAERGERRLGEVDLTASSPRLPA
jgi:hypothetical protein